MDILSSLPKNKREIVQPPIQDAEIANPGNKAASGQQLRTF